MMSKMKPPRPAQSTTRTLGQAATSPKESPVGMWDRIAAKSFELWRERECREGYALQDWLDAEAVVMEEIHEARE
jgi:hypothetical protein